MQIGEQSHRIYNVLRNLEGLEPLKKLFWSELSYERVKKNIPRKSFSKVASESLLEAPLLLASGGYENAFHIIYARFNSDKLLLTPERSIVSRLLNEHPYALFIFSNRNQRLWHFVNVKYVKDTAQAEKRKTRRIFRRITIGPDEKLRTASERIDLLDLAKVGKDGISALEIQHAHDRAFDVEAVTKQFYDDYCKVFKSIRKDISDQTKDWTWAHEYALQFLNRCMFLYFVQRKRWLGNDIEFVRTFWESYNAEPQKKNSFFSEWLSVLFFEAFNNRFHGGHKQFPDEIKKALQGAPYLNGGLFRENELDGKYAFNISDQLFTQVFDFLEKYNFTISEETPFDQEVAVDPEMIGKVYESLVNVSPETDERGQAGIFYTPRTEIDMMCRLALVDNLANHLGEKHKNLLYEAVFAIEAEEKKEADRALERVNLWPKLDETLRKIAIVDPACGSGSFLVGMLLILDDLSMRANNILGIDETTYARRKRIIGSNLYGVDVMRWAVHVAELRLWLQLVIESELEDWELKARPLLPNLSFKIRCGDSLVQEVGGVNMSHLKAHIALPASLKGRLTSFKGEKAKFYNNDMTCEYRDEKQLFQQELKFFKEIIFTQVKDIQGEIKKTKAALRQERARDIDMFTGEKEVQFKQMEMRDAERQKRIEELSEEMERLTKSSSALKTAQDVPFVWDIAFVEIFSDEKKGFDIVIGNPPYVRQESIADPRTPREDVTPENKREYKAKLAQSVYEAFLKFFGYNAKSGAVGHKIDAKSDLYIYFYLHGLSLLNPKGSFCFITSNSWLDVGYGKDLQEFLLRQCSIRMIIDNQVRRSFERADVNTVICLFTAPSERKDAAFDNTARFVMFTEPFEEVISPIIFEEIEKAKERSKKQEYRVHPIRQEALLEDGLELPQKEETEKKPKRKKVTGPLIKVARYIGNKWGGKYLRAPDLYWKLKAKSRRLFIPLASPLWDLRYGLKTGLTEFFYISKEKRDIWNIEEEFCMPIVHSTREIFYLNLSRVENKSFVFACKYTKEQLKEMKKLNALKYIEWGERQRTKKGGTHTRAGILFPNVPSVSGNSPWYSLRDHIIGDFAIPALIREKYQVICNDSRCLVSNMFYQGQIPTCYDKKLTWALLNSTLVYFMMEVVGRLNIGGRLNFYGPELSQILIPSPEIAGHSRSCESIKRCFEVIERRKVLPVREEIHTDERKELDKRILSTIGLPLDCLNEMYGWLEGNCAERLSKEKSL